jgi:uncharacterized protein YndB with AHSA1/START domain
MRADCGSETRAGLTPVLDYAPDACRAARLRFVTLARRATARGHGVIRIGRHFQASPERVFAAWLDAPTAGHWLFATASQPIEHVEIDARVGGSFRFVERRHGDLIEHAGRYLSIVPSRHLAFTLVLEERPRVVTQVSIEIVPLARGCSLALTHEHVLGDALERTKGRWTGILYGLGEMLDEAIFKEGHTRSKP